MACPTQKHWYRMILQFPSCKYNLRGDSCPISNQETLIILTIAREGSIKAKKKTPSVVWTHPISCVVAHTYVWFKNTVFIHVKQVCQWTLGYHSWMSICIWMAVVLGIESDECDGSAGQAGSLWQVSSVCWGRIEALLPPPSRADLWLPTSRDWQELLTCISNTPHHFCQDGCTIAISDNRYALRAWSGCSGNRHISLCRLCVLCFSSPRVLFFEPYNNFYKCGRLMRLKCEMRSFFAGVKILFFII